MEQSVHKLVPVFFSRGCWKALWVNTLHHNMIWWWHFPPSAFYFLFFYACIFNKPWLIADELGCTCYGIRQRYLPSKCQPIMQFTLLRKAQCTSASFAKKKKKKKKKEILGVVLSIFFYSDFFFNTEGSMISGSQREKEQGLWILWLKHQAYRDTKYKW